VVMVALLLMGGRERDERWCFYGEMGRRDLGIGWQNQEANDTLSVNNVSIVLSTGHADEQLQTNQPLYVPT
jgi:hypothetical protein